MDTSQIQEIVKRINVLVGTFNSVKSRIYYYLALYIYYLDLLFILFQAIHEDNVTAVDALLKHGEDATSKSLVKGKEYEQMSSTTW